ncbi:ATP-binding protein [Candidatus Micrarchaeota archaeon]|nr:ATP-binding protein [Candidatus Micrarchaeota archaeon]
MSPIEREGQPREGNGNWKPTTPIPEGVRHFSAAGTHVFDIDSRPEFHPRFVGKEGYEPLEALRSIFREYIEAKTGIENKRFQYDSTAAIIEAVTNAMVHAHNYDGRPVRVILQVRHPVTAAASQPKVLTIKVWDCGDGFPRDIHERVLRQVRKVERMDEELDVIKAKLKVHEAAIKQHESELAGLSETNPAHRRRMESIRKKLARRQQWLNVLQQRENENFFTRADMWGETGKKDTETGTGAGLFLIKQMTRQKHYGKKWGRLEFNELEANSNPYRNEVYIKIPLIQNPIEKK